MRPKPEHRVTCYNSFRYLLLESEKDRLQQYEQMWRSKFGWPAKHDPNAVFHLGDNPASRVCWTASGRFPSFRHSMGILWHAQSETIITPRERLSILGWPVYPELCSAVGLVPFEFPDVQRGSKYAGNAYHVSAFGMWLLTVLACVRIDHAGDHESQ